MKVDEIWEQYQKINPEAKEYEAWSYGSAPDKLLQLTLDGVKTATASCYDGYVLQNERIPEVGDYSILLDSKGDAHCIIRTTKVTILPFIDVPEEQGYLEGEGDRTLRYWREVHKEFFSEEMSKLGLEFYEEMKVVCEVFEMVYQP